MKGRSRRTGNLVFDSLEDLLDVASMKGRSRRTGNDRQSEGQGDA